MKHLLCRRALHEQRPAEREGGVPAGKLLPSDASLLLSDACTGISQRGGEGLEVVPPHEKCGPIKDREHSRIAGYCQVSQERNGLRLQRRAGFQPAGVAASGTVIRQRQSDYVRRPHRYRRRPSQEGGHTLRDACPVFHLRSLVQNRFRILRHRGEKILGVLHDCNYVWQVCQIEEVHVHPFVRFPINIGPTNGNGVP